MHKTITIVLSIAVGAVLGAGVYAVVTKTSSTPNSNQAISNTPVNVNGAGTPQPSGNTVRGPFPTDSDGCSVIDLRGVAPTNHDAASRVYTWLVEHPADATCVRQTNPTISEPVVNTRSEKIRDTNNWKLEFFY